MLLARPLIRLILAPALALALSGCPSLTERAGLPPSVERAETLERGGDAAGAARGYEQPPAQNSGDQRARRLARRVRPAPVAGAAARARLRHRDSERGGRAHARHPTGRRLRRRAADARGSRRGGGISGTTRAASRSQLPARGAARSAAVLSVRALAGG